MKTLRWDPTVGPVEGPLGMNDAIPETEDSAGRHALTIPPSVIRQVGGCELAQAPEARASQRFSQQRHYEGRAWLNSGFTENPVLNQRLIDDLFGNCTSPGEAAGWLMTLYEAMRRRGHWPVNLPIEQLLADEEVFIQWGEISPPCPASIQ